MDDTTLILTAIAVTVPLGIIMELIVDFIKTGSNSDEPNYYET